MCKKLFCLVSFVLLLNVAGITRADLVGYWTLDEGSGTTIHDSSGNGNDGTLVDNPVWDITWISGPSGGLWSSTAWAHRVATGTTSIAAVTPA